MLILALLLAAGPPSDQILAGPAFERFARRADRSCPARALRTITPGDLDLLEEDFADALVPRARARLAGARGGADRCADRNGLSCSANATLGAIERGALLRSFVAFACARRPPR